MKNVDILKHLDKDIKLLKKHKQSYNFRRYTWKRDKYHYKIDLVANITDGESIFDKTVTGIQFQTAGGANKLIKEINEKFNKKIKMF